MGYRLTLTQEDIEAISFVGYRYSWSSALANMQVGANEITEPDAWEIQDAFEADTEGGHSMFPMLDSHSELYSKLISLLEQIV